MDFTDHVYYDGAGGGSVGGGSGDFVSMINKLTL